MFGGGQLAYLANLRGLLVKNALRRGVLHQLCLFLCPAPRKAVIEPCEASTAAATMTANPCACCRSEGKNVVGLAHMTKSLTSTVRGHETYTTHLCCSDTEGRLFDIFVCTASFFSEALSIYSKFDIEQAKLKAEAEITGLICQEKDKRQGRVKGDIYLQTLSKLYSQTCQHTFILHPGSWIEEDATTSAIACIVVLKANSLGIQALHHPQHPQSQHQKAKTASVTTSHSTSPHARSKDTP